jgi:glycosyltransferase involved in cell wall biosynthesis
MIESAGLADRVVRLQPADEEMPEVYRRATAFLFPSRYEGFGLPTLEALASGTPTILADASCSQEVGGDAALYFAPGDVDELVDRISVAMSPNERSRVASAGPAHGRQFTWEKAAERTAALYRSLMP